MPASMVLPGDVEQALLATLGANLTDIYVGAIGKNDIGDDDQLILQMPCARQRYVSTDYKNEGDNQWLTYDVSHIFEIWAAAEDLTSREAQRTATLAVIAEVLPIVAGARLNLADGSVTEPVAVKSISGLPEDIIGRLYILTIEVCAIAQFPGALSAGNEDD